MIDSDEENPVTLWAEIWRLRKELEGPSGFATWKDVAVAERIKRVECERKLQTEAGHNEQIRKDIEFAICDKKIHIEIADNFVKSQGAWRWQGDGSDHLESLTCPVLIRPQELIDLIVFGHDTYRTRDK